MSDPRNFLMNTDYPFDIVISLKSGSFSVSGFHGNADPFVVPVPHGLGFAPLPSGNWSLSSDFSLQYEHGTGDFPGSAGLFYNTLINVCADATNYYLLVENASATRTIYYRLFGLQPSDNTSDIVPIANLGDTYLLSTDYNNMKLFDGSTVNLPATPTVSINVPIFHGLGYIPRTMGWVHYPTWNGTAVVQG